MGFQEVHDWMVLSLASEGFYCYHFFTFSFPLINLYCSVVLFPVAVTFFITWWFIQFVDGFFSPIYERLGIDIFGKSFSHDTCLA